MGKPGLLRYTNTISQNVTCYFLCKTSVTLCNKEPDTKWKVRDGKNVATHDAISMVSTSSYGYGMNIFNGL